MYLYSKEQYKIILFLIIMHIKILLSKAQKCYSIYNCKKSPELDICEICLKGYSLNKTKNKCIKSPFPLSITFPKVSVFKLSEKYFSKINASSALKPLDKNFNYSSIRININEIISYPKVYDIIKVSNISSNYIKKEDESIPIYKHKQSINKTNSISINPKNLDNDFYFRISICWIVLIIVVLVILIILYFSRKERERIKCINDDLEEISRIVNIR